MILTGEQQSDVLPNLSSSLFSLISIPTERAESSLPTFQDRFEGNLLLFAAA